MTKPLFGKETSDSAFAQAGEMIRKDQAEAAHGGMVELFNLAADLMRAQSAVADAQASLLKAVLAEKDVAERLIPDAMQRLGLEDQSFPYKDLRTGQEFTISIDKSTLASVACEHRARPNAAACEECRQKAYGWLRGIGQAGIIKHEMFVPLGLMKEEAVHALMEKVAELLPPDMEVGEAEHVEPSTLRATVQQLLKEGVSIDASIKTTPQRVAKMKKKTSRKKETKA